MWKREIKKKQLELSNGSIGIINNKKGSDGNYRAYYFTDKAKPLYKMDDDDNFELAYAITIHKSLGSDFKNVFLVIPNRHALLSKELVYTALTRSTHGVTLFLQETEDNILEIAKDRSFIQQRNTSIFTNPEDAKAKYEPANAVYVKSKVEYIIYKALERTEGIKFFYEKELLLKNKIYNKNRISQSKLTGKHTIGNIWGNLTLAIMLRTGRKEETILRQMVRWKISLLQMTLMVLRKVFY